MEDKKLILSRLIRAQKYNIQNNADLLLFSALFLKYLTRTSGFNHNKLALQNAKKISTCQIHQTAKTLQNKHWGIP